MPRFLARAAGIQEAAFAGEAGRHGDNLHVVGAEGVGADGGGEGGVDAAGEAHKSLGEAVLPDVVAGADDQRIVDLGGALQNLSHAGLSEGRPVAAGRSRDMDN